MLSKWIGQAAKIDSLNREIDFLRRQCQFAEDRAVHAETKVELLDKSIVSERNKHDKFVALAMDRLVVKNGSYGTFQKELFPKKEALEPTIEPEVLSKIEMAAKEQMDADVAYGYEPQPLEFYVNAIKADPTRFLPS